MGLKQLLSLGLLASAVLFHTLGCGGGGNTVEYPENPDPLPKDPPVSAGVPGPSTPPKTDAKTPDLGPSEEPKTDARAADAGPSEDPKTEAEAPPAGPSAQPKPDAKTPSE